GRSAGIRAWRVVAFVTDASGGRDLREQRRHQEGGVRRIINAPGSQKTVKSAGSIVFSRVQSRGTLARRIGSGAAVTAAASYSRAASEPSIRFTALPRCRDLPCSGGCGTPVALHGDRVGSAFHFQEIR